MLILACKSIVLCMCSGKYIHIYFSFKITYLNNIWKKRKLNNKGQKHNKVEKQNSKNFETEKYGDHSYYKKT